MQTLFAEIMSLILNLLIIVVSLTLFNSVISRQIITVNRNELEAEKELPGNKLFQSNTVTETNVRAERNTENELLSADDAVPNPTVPSSGKTKKKRQKPFSNGKKQWFRCANESTPTQVSWQDNNKGVMCSREYPFYTCCPHHDLTMDLLGSKMAELVSDHRCAHLLKTLRCAHCSPRSWWLFHAPDKRRLPHKRVVPIMCPKFCKKFQSSCRDSITGLQNDDFCQFHTSNEDGPCFPDYNIRRGTID